MLKAYTVLLSFLLALMSAGCGPSGEADSEEMSSQGTEAGPPDHPTDFVDDGAVEGQLFGSCHTNNGDRGEGDLYESGTGRHEIALTWVSPYGPSGGNVKIYFKKAWSFRGKRDGEPLVITSNGMSSGQVVIRGLERNECYKFAAYQDVYGASSDVLLGITKAKTNRR